MNPKEIELPSGAVLKIYPAPFADSKALYQAMLDEARGVQITKDNELGNMFKDFFCIAFSSKKVEACLSECLKKCTYNDLAIAKDTFEPLDARADYTMVCMEVAKENVAPFAKSLYAEYQRILAMISATQA